MIGASGGADGAGARVDDLLSAATLLANDIVRPLSPDFRGAVACSRAASCRRGAGRRLLHAARRPDDRRVAADGLLVRHTTLSRVDLQPDGAKSADETGRGVRHHRGRGRGRLRDADQEHFADLLPFLPARIDDINIGFAALIVNVVVSAVVSLATRPAAVPVASHSG